MASEHEVRWLVQGCGSGEPMTAVLAAEKLNELLSLDPNAVTGLFSTRVKCNEAIAEHPNVFIRQENGECSLGILGVINGILIEQNERVVTVWNEKGLAGFIAVRIAGE